MDDDIVGLVVGIILFCLFVAAIVFAAVAAVPVGVGAAIWGYFVWQRNRPENKEYEAQQQTRALLNQAYDLQPPPFLVEFNRRQLNYAGQAIYELEGFEPPGEPPLVHNSVQGARYRDRLTKYINSAHSQDEAAEYQRRIKANLGVLDAPDHDEARFVATRPITAQQMEELILSFFEGDRFPELRRRLDNNYRAVGVFPTEYRGRNLAEDYLKDTPLYGLHEQQLRIDLKNRDQHTHILGGSGHGKTQLIQYMISRDLEEDCTIVVIDNQGQMIPKLAELDISIDDVTYISPSNDLGINLFDIGYQELKESGAEGEINAAVELLEYVLGGLLETELTGKQQIVFQYALQLVVAIPGGNINTLRHILKPKGWCDYADVVDTLPRVVREFFEQEFDNDRQFGKTKEEINYRLWGLLKNPTFARIFSATENPVDMYDELAESKLVLIDTDLNRLGEKGSALFGKLFIAQILQAARQRFSKPHRPAYVYIDEAPIYFDKNLATMLEQARKANIGLILAHQSLDQAKGINHAIMGNTATKFVGGVSNSDAYQMAGNMNTTADFIKDQRPLHFALYMRGDDVYSVEVPTGVIEDMPKRNNMSELIAEMEKSYGYSEREEPEEPEINDDEYDDDDIVPGDTL